MCGRWLSERPTNHVEPQRWTEGKDKDSIYQFNHGDCRKGLQEIPKSTGGRGDFFDKVQSIVFQDIFIYFLLIYQTNWDVTIIFILP